MSQSFIIGLFSFILLLLIVITFFAWHLRSIRSEAHTVWKQILEKTRLRIDMIPSVIETVRRYGVGDAVMISEMVKLRSSCWPMTKVIPAKVNAELSLSQSLHVLWNEGMRHPELSHDTNFLALKKDITDLGKQIEELEDHYNQKIRNYNKKIDVLFLHLFGLKKLPIFEFEA